MGRKRLYATAADRYKAYRERRHAGLPATPAVTSAAPIAVPKRKPTRPARLAAVLAAVEDLRDEYQDWLENLPPSLAESETAAKLGDTVDRLTRAVDEMAEVDLPKGFGRD